MSGLDPDDPWPEVLEWLQVAASDQRAVRLCLSANPPLCDVATFHCQQAAEKLLNGFLVRAGVDFRKTCDLDALAQSVLVHFPSLEPLLTPMRTWTAWSVAYRYPGESGPQPEPSADEMSQALDAIERLDMALRLLAPTSGASGTAGVDPG